MPGYLDNPEANAEAFDDGWFRSGDLASLDSEGRITIRGRSKLLIEVSGYKIDPIEVEETLAAHPAIADAAVIGVPDARSGNRLRAYVVRDADVSPDEVIRHAREQLSVQKVHRPKSPSSTPCRKARPASCCASAARSSKPRASPHRPTRWPAISNSSTAQDPFWGC